MNESIIDSKPQFEMGPSLFKATSEYAKKSYEGFIPLVNICYISKGMVLHSEDPEGKVRFTKDDLISAIQDKVHPKGFMEGKYLNKWVVRKVLYLEYGTKRAPALCSRPTFSEFYEVPEKLISMDISGGTARAAYDNQQLFHNHSAWSFVLWHHLKGVKNKSIKKTAKYKSEFKTGKVIPDLFREDLEKLSKDYALKYLLALMNSTFASKWLLTCRRSKIHVYPDDWKKFPVPPISMLQQQEFVKLVDAILNELTNNYSRSSESAVRVREIEREIDERVAALYGVPLNPDEPLQIAVSETQPDPFD